MKVELVKINACHRADVKDKNLHNKTIHANRKGIYIIYDKSSWYVKETIFKGIYETTEYRMYLG